MFFFKRPKYPGKLIIIDGTDGAGKETQTGLLIACLEKSGLRVMKFDFPQYGRKSAGAVEEYLRGDYGPADEVGPWRASVFYAVDRYAASFGMKRFLKDGYIIVSNRYVAANMGHQGGKIRNPFVRKIFFFWLYWLEYVFFKIPFPDLNIILYVDPAVGQKLVDQKGARAYIGGNKRDIHEADINHLKNAAKTYREIARALPGFSLIDCTENGWIISRKKILEKIMEKIKPLLKS